MVCCSQEWQIQTIASSLKADSHKLCLMCAAVADGCISAEMGNFLFFRTTHFCHSRMYQMQLV